jgi:hypothetical protein
VSENNIQPGQKDNHFVCFKRADRSPNIKIDGDDADGESTTPINDKERMNQRVRFLSQTQHLYTCVLSLYVVQTTKARSVNWSEPCFSLNYFFGCCPRFFLHHSDTAGSRAPVHARMPASALHCLVCSLQPIRPCKYCTTRQSRQSVHSRSTIPLFLPHARSTPTRHA